MHILTSVQEPEKLYSYYIWSENRIPSLLARLPLLNQMVKHKVFDIRGREVGFWDDQEFPRLYHTFRNFNLNQIFKSSHFNNEVGIDLRIIEKVLIPNDIRFLDYLIIGFEKLSFHAYIDLKNFLELGREVEFEGKQIIVPLEYFKREHPKENLMNF